MSRKPPNHAGNISNYSLATALELDSKPGGVLTQELAQKINREAGRSLHGSTLLTDLYYSRNNAWYSATTHLPPVAREAIANALSSAIKIYTTVEDVRKSDSSQFCDRTARKQISFLVLALSLGVK
jgi:hypothetical protein